MQRQQKIAAAGKIKLRRKLRGVSNGEFKVALLPKQADAAAVARYWFKRGIRCVPIAPKSKKPIGGPGWNKVKVELDTIDQLFRRKSNVGGLWGEPSNGIIDIDLDTEESRLAASVLLPETFVYGRASSPASHYLYQCKGMNTRKYQTKEHGTFVEIRSTGTQSVLPPSIHPDDEPYEIYHDVEFSTIGVGRLEMVCRQVATAALIAYNFPEKGARHDFILAVAGTLLHKGWDDAEVAKFLDAVLTGAGSDGEDREKHGRTIRNAIKNFRAGNRITGWRTLTQFMNDSSLATIREWLGVKGIDSDEAPDVIEPNQKDVGPPLDPKLLKVPGLVGEVAEWAFNRAITPQPLFCLATGLCTIALCSRNMYLVDNWSTPLQPYILMIAPTSSGKESSMDSVFIAARKANLGEHVFENFQSYHAMLDTLAKPPNLAHMNWDEAARRLKTASRSHGSMEYQIITYLLRLYGKAGSSVPGMPGRKNAVMPIDYPFFSLLAAAQPEQLLSALTEADLQLGLINRFILLDVGNTKPPLNPHPQNFFPSRLEEALLKFGTLKRPTNGGNPFRPVRFDSMVTINKFKDFFEDCRELGIEGGASEIWGRSTQNALICAGIVAVGVNQKQPVINGEIAEWAIAFIRWTSKRWVARVEESSARTPTERGSKYLESVIFNVRRYVDRAYSGPERQLITRGLAPKSLLYRMARHLRGRDMEDALTQLCLGNLVASGEVEGRTCYWPKTVKT